MDISEGIGVLRQKNFESVSYGRKKLCFLHSMLACNDCFIICNFVTIYTVSQKNRTATINMT